MAERFSLCQIFDMQQLSGNNTPLIPLPNPGGSEPASSGEAPGGNGSGGNPGAAIGSGGTGNPGSTDSGNFHHSSGGFSGTVLPNRASTAKVRFLNAAFGYPAFQILVGNAQVVNFLGYAALSPYRYYYAGYRTVTLRGTDGTVYLQKTMPLDAGSVSTIAVIQRAGGLDLLQISDHCCAPTGYTSNFRVSNLAYSSGALDVLLSDGRVVYADVHFKETTSYKRIRPGAYEFLFSETDLTPSPAFADIETLDSEFLGAYPVPDLVASVYLTVQSNVNYTVYLLSSGSEVNAVQTLVAEDP